MSANKPLVSVYTPTYNRAKILIERAASSVLAQSMQDFEYIIVGDACTDNTEEMVLALQDKRIRFLNLKARERSADPEITWLIGPTYASNKALSMVKGRWIARIDDDDIWTEDHLEILLRKAAETRADFVSARTLIDKGWFNKKKDDCFRIESPYYGYSYEDDTTPLIGATSTWLYKSKWRKIRYDANCHKNIINRVNDTDYVQRLWKAGCSMAFTDQVINICKPRPGEKEIGRKAIINSWFRK